MSRAIANLINRKQHSLVALHTLDRFENSKKKKKKKKRKKKKRKTKKTETKRSIKGKNPTYLSCGKIQKGKRTLKKTVDKKE